ncbi:phasin family protein [Paenibacillus sp. GCM10027626]|uniref:phasin family protein n=1 Tax=Paenibacillus sp. GCM10027626 TaxID=3273411 RepID=UPI003633B208
MMKDFVNRAISLGFGVVSESKEQIEKMVEELVKKGEVSRAESSDVVNGLVQKGDELKSKIEAVVREKVQLAVKESGAATREDVQRLEARIAKLEELLQDKS